MSAIDIEEEVAGLLKTADQRFTSGRRSLVSVLKKGGGPLTITQILDLDKSLPQSSVYRNLTCLLYTSPSPRDQRGSRMPSSA